jgi:predicted DNA-binding helix-hairpin-helix protein
MAADAPEPLLPVVADGDYRRSLEALRDRLAAGIDRATDRQLIHLAPIARQLADVLRAIEELPDEAKADAVDDIAARRARRIAG